MTEHAAHELHAETPAETPAGTPGGHGHDGHHDSPEAIRREMKKYLTVFAALAGLTIVTVVIARFHLPMWQAVTLALAVATLKAGLVAAVFMHLMSEKKLVYTVLGITMFFFAVLMWGPWHHRYDAMGQTNVSAPAPEAPAGQPQGH